MARLRFLFFGGHLLPLRFARLELPLHILFLRCDKRLGSDDTRVKSREERIERTVSGLFSAVPVLSLRPIGARPPP